MNGYSNIMARRQEDSENCEMEIDQRAGVKDEGERRESRGRVMSSYVEAGITVRLLLNETTNMLTKVGFTYT